MNLGLDGRRFLVTAASRGLGFSIARELLREGARVVISSSNAERIADASARLRTEGLTPVAATVADLLDASSIERLVDSAYATLGGLDGLVTNCGGPPAGAPLAITDSQWQTAYDSVFLSVIRLCRLVVPRLVDQGDGAVLAVTSTTVKQPIQNLTTSNALRPALAGYLRYLADEVASRNVRVNLIAPGRFLTERSLELETALAQRLNISLAEARARYAQEIPMGRIGAVDEFPALCAFLLSPRASYITGQTYCIDGGRVASIF